jgi:hypothetical protein
MQVEIDNLNINQLFIEFFSNFYKDLGNPDVKKRALAHVHSPTRGRSQGRLIRPPCPVDSRHG